MCSVFGGIHYGLDVQPLLDMLPATPEFITDLVPGDVTESHGSEDNNRYGCSYDLVATRILAPRLYLVH